MDFITGIDFSILDFIYNNIRCDFLDPIMAGISFFADKGIGWIILGLILLIPRKTRPAAACALAAMIVGLLCGELVIKHLIPRERPFIVYEAYHNSPIPFVLNTGKPTGSSFPSGHTVCSFAAAVCFFKINKPVGFAALVFALLVGFSRLYNYVHFPSDVLGGMILGIAAGLVMMLIFRKLSLDDKLLRIRNK